MFLIIQSIVDLIFQWSTAKTISNSTGSPFGPKVCLQGLECGTSTVCLFQGFAAHRRTRRNPTKSSLLVTYSTPYPILEPNCSVRSTSGATSQITLLTYSSRLWLMDSFFFFFFFLKWVAMHDFITTYKMWSIWCLVRPSKVDCSPGPWELYISGKLWLWAFISWNFSKTT